MSEVVPLRMHKDRIEHLYTINYFAHEGRRALTRWIERWGNKITPKALSELQEAMKIIRILDDFEGKKND